MSKIKPLTHCLGGKHAVIRNANLDDAEKLVELIKRIDTETDFLLREPDEFTLTVEQEEKFISSKLDSEIELFILADIDGVPVGTCGLVGSTRKRLKHTANLGIALRRDYWGLGIGRRLMETVINWAKENGITRITLQVDTNNFRALTLYTKLGFEVEGTFKNDKKMADGSYRNSYAMALVL